MRRQIYWHEADDRLLEEQSAATGLSVSELVRRAVQQCYGRGQRLTWDSVFAARVCAGAPTTSACSYDESFDAALVDQLLREAEPDRPPATPLT